MMDGRPEIPTCVPLALPVHSTQGAALAKRVAHSLMVLLVGIPLGAPAQAADVRNSSFREARGSTNTSEMIAALREKGWSCPDAKDWPHSWGGQGADMTVEFPSTGGRDNDSYCRLTGGVNGYVNGYWGKPFKKTQVLTFWVRGKGTLRVGLMAYKLSDDQKMVIGGGRVPPLDIKVDSRDWVRYRHLMRKPDYELTGHPLFQVPDGTIDFDDVDIVDSDPALDLVAAEEATLYGTGALLESISRARVDDAFATRRREYDAAVQGLADVSADLSKKLMQAIDQRTEALKPYIHTKGINSIRATHYNDMIVLTRVMKQLAGKDAGEAGRVKAMNVDASDAKPHYPGRRDPRPNALTITRVRSNKVLYNENEPAKTTATLVNSTDAAMEGTLRARMIYDLDSVRELSSTAFTMAAGEEKTWTFSYNVGPETYGRAIEVEFVDNAGKKLDSWQEYYAVAREFFRVHQHSYQTKTKYWPADPHIFYFNQSHYFAHEPTGFGAEPFDAEVYVSGQAGYRINVPARKAQIAHNKTLGIRTSFYVIGAFDGQMGYEAARQHPEFLLYDENGQPAVDPVYGGYPNPMELASPLEVGPKRKEMKVKPHLDREYRPWQHVGVNMAREDAVVWALERMKVYADEWGFDGIYWDGCLGVWAGYAHDGTRNVPSGKYEDYVRLGARNHRLWNEILRRDDPYFGTWMNWGLEGATGDFAKNNGITIWLGSGVEGDPLDDNVRAATEAKNVMVLDETSTFQGHDYRKLLNDRITSRDHYVQKYGASHCIGYAGTGVDMHNPGPSKWGWPTWNYLMAQLTATQSHLASHFVPSHRPSFQFMTRYSRFIWAPDIKALSADEAEKLLQVDSTEELWWKRLVYERKTDNGRDIIVHLLRVPPTNKADYKWADEPEPLEGTTVGINTAGMELKTAHACRPYHYEDPQQVVQTVVDAEDSDEQFAVSLPPFRYHTMVVFRLETN